MSCDPPLFFQIFIKFIKNFRWFRHKYLGFRIQAGLNVPNQSPFADRGRIFRFRIPTSRLGIPGKEVKIMGDFTKNLEGRIKFETVLRVHIFCVFETVYLFGNINFDASYYPARRRLTTFLNILSLDSFPSFL